MDTCARWSMERQMLDCVEVTAKSRSLVRTRDSQLGWKAAVACLLSQVMLEAESVL